MTTIDQLVEALAGYLIGQLKNGNHTDLAAIVQVLLNLLEAQSGQLNGKLKQGGYYKH